MLKCMEFTYKSVARVASNLVASVWAILTAWSFHDCGLGVGASAGGALDTLVELDEELNEELDDVELDDEELDETC